MINRLGVSLSLQHKIWQLVVCGLVCQLRNLYWLYTSVHAIDSNRCIKVFIWNGGYVLQWCLALVCVLLLTNSFGAHAAAIGATTYYCSTAHTGSANLNEIVFQGATINYVETKMLDSPTDANGWYLCSISGNLNSAVCQVYGGGELTVGAILDKNGCKSNTINTCDLNDTDHPLGEYLAWPTSISGSEGELILFDSNPVNASAGVIDYMHYCLDTACSSDELTIQDNSTDQNSALGTGAASSTDSTICGNVVDIDYNKGELAVGDAAVIARLTDGTGEWVNSGDTDSPIYGTDSGSSGVTNDDPATSATLSFGVAVV